MAKNGYIMVGLGELFWDIFPESKTFAPAPANFAYYASALGHRGIVASRIGQDQLGKEALDLLNSSKVDTSFLQTDELAPTGTVVVENDPKNQPQYTIPEEVAWDYLDWGDKWQTLASQADVICFGSVAQRSPQSRHAIRRFIRAAGKDCLRIFDANLFQPWYSVEKINESMLLADIVKLSDTELPQIFRTLGLKLQNLRNSARLLLDTFGLKMVVLTRGRLGAMLVTEKQIFEHQGFKIKPADSLGAADAFTAVIAHHYLKNTPLDRAVEAANRLAAFVASKPSAMPQIDKNTLSLVLNPPQKRPNGRPNRPRR